eukprot:8366581-Lingulodinium_polyedra.AAC.1
MSLARNMNLSANPISPPWRQLLPFGWPQPQNLDWKRTPEFLEPSSEPIPGTCHLCTQLL